MPHYGIWKPSITDAVSYFVARANSLRAFDTPSTWAYIFAFKGLHHNMRLWRMCASLSVDCHSITSCRPHIQSPKVDTLAPNLYLLRASGVTPLTCTYVQTHGHIPIIFKEPIPCGPKIPACATQTFTNTRREHTLNQAADLLHRR